LLIGVRCASRNPGAVSPIAALRLPTERLLS